MIDDVTSSWCRWMAKSQLKARPSQVRLLYAASNQQEFIFRLLPLL
jgi:hypothetical protein